MTSSTGDDYSNIPVRLTEASEGPSVNLEPLLDLLISRARQRRSRLRLITPPTKEDSAPPAKRPKKSRKRSQSTKPHKNRSPKE